MSLRNILKVLGICCCVRCITEVEDLESLGKVLTLQLCFERRLFRVGVGYNETPLPSETQSTDLQETHSTTTVDLVVVDDMS